ncbi:MAG: 16S rRNA (adenine(1518)-N(6)/adenine(1519)-N(6))-dimethyltransferase RsmA, partial [Gammaproteobacteria bacterium]
VEIGPGRGALTFPLLRLCGRLTAIEIDRDLVPVLIEKAAPVGELEIVNADILDFDLSELGGSGDFRLLGNLPYNISTPLLFHLLDSAALIRDMHFMLQEEVARRIVAAPGGGNYGRLSVMLQYHCRCEYLFGVPPASFRPPPKVDSAVVRLSPHAEPEYEIGDYAIFSDIVKSAFGQRRKTISNSLKSILDRDAISACGIDPGLRAENLTLADFATLSRFLGP